MKSCSRFIRITNCNDHLKLWILWVFSENNGSWEVANEGVTVLHMTCISAFYLTYPGSIWEQQSWHDNSTPITEAPAQTSQEYSKLYGRFIVIKCNIRRKTLTGAYQGSHFLRGSFSNRDTVITPIQFRRERQSQHLKR